MKIKTVINGARIRDVAFALFVLSGLFYMFDQIYQRILFAIASALTIFVFCFYWRRILFRLRVSYFFYYLFLASFFVEGLYFASVTCFVYGGAMLFTLMLSDNKSTAVAKKHITLAISIDFWFILICLFLCVALTGLSVSNYSGIFFNPNTLGIAAGQLFVICIIRLDEKITIQKKKPIWEIIILIISLMFTLFSSCRTALLGEAVCVMLYAIYYLKMHPSSSRKTLTILFLIALVFAVIIGYSYGLFDTVLSRMFIFSKTAQVRRRFGSISTGRFSIWQYIWSNTGLLGNGESVLIGTAAHNVYFGLMNDFGKINAFLFFFFTLAFMCSAFKCAFFAGKTSCELVPLLTSCYFFCVSMTESYLMTSPMIMMFACFPIIRDS